MANGRDTSALFRAPQQNHHHQQQQQHPKEKHHQSSHLLLLQKEIKEEEEQIFADINSFINSSSSGLFFTFDDDDNYRDDDSREEERSSSSSGTGLLTNSNHNNNNNTNHQFPFDSEQAAFSEEEQLDDQAIQAVIHQVQSNLPKPCVFFLEGNCRRSDCKYSHDLSNITCKYWIEGFCFKGELCPFQHSYSLSTDNSLLDANNLAVDSKQLNPTFAIESEADFPPLALDAQPPNSINDAAGNRSINSNSLYTELEHQILSSNSAVVFKTVKKKRKRG